VVVSIFVNPIQFDRGDDYDRYPRTLATDAEFCAARGTDIIFAPDAREMYPAPLRTSVNVAVLSEHLCGRYRPGHFQGVATVVAKLFNIVQPDIAYFGEKDAQQLAIIERMAADLNMPITICRVPTVRETDGLALSSRNQRLGAEERRAAPVLYRALCAARERMPSVEEAKRTALAIIAEEPLVRVEYLEVVDQEMTPVQEVRSPARIAVAAWLGSTRLIDNVSV
jgi:pantoate--beta-alanine ligase